MIKLSFSSKNVNIDEFSKKCQEGENDSFICSLIRRDYIEEFVSYVKRTNYPLKKEIPHSIYETNDFLNAKQATLIEYASFFGSIQIIHFLKANNIELTPSLWLYSIHSNDANLIHFLEESKVPPPGDTYESCFKEAIKCYHNEIARYMHDNYLSDEKESKIQNFINLKDYKETLSAYVFRFHNPEFVEECLNDKFLMLCLCEYNYIDILELLLKTSNFSLDVTVRYYTDYRKKILRVLNPFTLAMKKGNNEICNILLNCPGLTNDKGWLDGYSTMKSYEFPSLFITEISKNLFSGCDSLTTVDIPDSVTIIEEEAFQLCHSLQHVTIPPHVTKIGKKAFFCCYSLDQVIIQPSVNEIAESTFEQCKILKQITIPNSVTKIGKSAFNYCELLMEVNIPSSVTEIADYAFQSCLSLKHIEIPSSVKSIGNNAFTECTRPESIIIPNSVVSFGKEVFRRCTFFIKYHEFLQNCIILIKF